MMKKIGAVSAICPYRNVWTEYQHDEKHQPNQDQVKPGNELKNKRHMSIILFPQTKVIFGGSSPSAALRRRGALASLTSQSLRL